MSFFRIGCFALILTGLLHLIGHFQEPVPKNDTEKQLFELMEAYKIDIGMDTTITVLSIQNGFSLWFSLSFLWVGATGLFLLKQFKENTQALRKVAIVNTLGLTIGLGISLTYFFFIPTTCILVCLGSFVIAVIRLK